MAGAVELICGVAVLAGVLTRWASLVLALRTVVAILAVQGAGIATSGDLELGLLRLGALIALACTGPQRYAVESYAPKVARYDAPLEMRKAA